MEFSIAQAAKAARIASRQIAKLSAVQKETLLKDIAQRMLAQTDGIIAANKQDLSAGRENNLDDAMLDRLLLTPERIQKIAHAVNDIAAQADPVGSIEHMQQMPSGIQVGKMRIPLGVIAMIYESRPNVTIDAAALCLKAGNAVILRGGKEALHSNLALAECISFALDKNGLDPAAVVVVPNPDRAVMNELMTLNQDIDLIIPRGGEGLIRFVSENSRIPVIQHYKGVCHLYVDDAADESKALNLLKNGKTQRTGVCNSLETLLVHQDIAPTFMLKVRALFDEFKVKVHACERSLGYFENAALASEDDWHAEYLAMEIAVRIVDDFDAAIEHIETYSSGHTEVIATQDFSRAQAFIRTLNSAVVMANASSRFSDGGELGLGAEIGISTSKLHAYGPMGAESLTTQKFIVLGDGEVRA
ncbi:glutamate-5-semialdehyde dehydrogenase [Paraglaciecola polaris]|uniref:Gamma-glutamyl phosphate reductase n=1 Tax=Paraglaciecola polaris LMG 21857 TaxID=1129793 RepID=K6YEN5_9ALTE|nr:glutamate-5-semialdehyde dehydrogenase [Paraglaciecola polaris]GAC31204.1 glutamate-5-semialdehyde dehydrogenase [Paraglaciecola polaris LMG 21857]|tara:strand:- start:3139 stop:4389 length:1251 start_codon:yes stop_codon:yes gene_type:complete